MLKELIAEKEMTVIYSDDENIFDEIFSKISVSVLFAYNDILLKQADK